MPPAVGRGHGHAPHMSNPFASVNPAGVPSQLAGHYATTSQQLPSAFGFGGGGAGAAAALNGGISPFAPSSAYGGSAFTTAGNGSSAFGAAGGQGLASVAAQQGFARGAAIQEQAQAQLDAASMHGGSGLKSGLQARIRDVWRGNLDQEFETLRQLILKYPYVSMDAEFPGIVARPIGNFGGSKAEYHYQTLRANVDLLKPIQLGITLWTIDGDLPSPDLDPSSLNTNSRGPNGAAKSVYASNNLMPCPCTWVFNFEFNLENEMYSSSSIDLLRSSGVDFTRHAQHGISLERFGSLLITSGLTFTQDVNWLSFHSGYDFGYLLKLVTAQQLPAKPEEFFELVSTFFPKLWDIKFLLRHAQRTRTQQPGKLTQTAVSILDNLGQKSGLADLATELECTRIGMAHTGGSDAWLTGSVFFSMISKIFGTNTSAFSAGATAPNTLSSDLETLADQIYGLHGVAPPASQQYREEFLALAAQGTPQGTTSLNGASSGFTPGGGPATPTSTHTGISSQQTPGHTFGPALTGAGFGGGAGAGGFPFAK